MKKLIYFLIILMFAAGSSFQYKNSITEKASSNSIMLNKKTINPTNKRNRYISVMYTTKSNEEYIANYGIYDMYLNEFKTIYSIKKNSYSNFAFDSNNNNIYYSDLIENHYNIYRADLSKKDQIPIKLLKDNINGDILNLYKNRIVFRSFDKVDQRHTIGSYDLANGKVRLWNNTDKDSTIYNFYCNSFNSKIYTIERSIKEMHTKKFPNIPKHRIIQYSENGVREKEVYSTNKFIHNLSVNNEGNKALFDAVNIEGNKPINKIYMVDLNSLKEEIMITPEAILGKYKFSIIKMPHFSPDGEGFYFLGSTPTSAIVEKLEGTVPTTANSIYYYEFLTKNIIKIFEISNEFINLYKLQ